MTDVGAAADGREIIPSLPVSCYNEKNLIAGTPDNVVAAATEVDLSYEASKQRIKIPKRAIAFTL